MAAAAEPVNQELALKRMFAAIKPRLTRSDLSDTRRRDDLVRVVHEAAYSCSSYRDVASFVRNALCALDRSNTWSVIVAKDMYLKAKKREGETSLLSVPALLRDVVALCHSAKSLDEVSAIASAAGRSQLLSFSVLAFKAGSDEADAAGRAEALRAPPAPGAVGPSGYGGAAAPLPLDCEVLKAHLGEVRLPEVALQASAASAAEAADHDHDDAAAAGSGSSSRKRKGAASAAGSGSGASAGDALACVLRTIGALQRQVTGLDASSEGAFCNALAAALTADYGSTWHVVLSAAGHKGAKQPIATATPKKADAASSAAAGAAAAGTAAAPASADDAKAQRYSLGGLVSAALMRDLIASPAHAPAYDVVFETTPREASAVGSADTAAGPGAVSGAASAAADGAKAESSAAAVSSGTELVQRGKGSRRDAAAAAGAGSATDAAAQRSRLEVRYLELTLRSCPPPSAAAAASAALAPAALDQNPLRDADPAPAAADAAAAPAAGSSSAPASTSKAQAQAQQSEFYTLSVFRTGFAFLQAADGPGVADGSVPLLPSGTLSLSATPTLLPSTAAAPGTAGAKTAAALAPPPRRARVCFGYFDSWDDLMSRARWALLFAGLTAVVFFVGAYMNSRDTHCIRPGHSVPFVPALGLMASTLMPQPLSSMFGRRLLPMLGSEIAAVAPHLFPGSVVPAEVLAAAGFASAASASTAGEASAAAAAVDPSSAGEFGAAAAASALADAAASAAAAGEPMGAGGCTLRESILAEIGSGQSWAVLYVGLTAFALMSALRWTRKGYDRARVTAVLRSVSEASASGSAGAAPAGGRAAAAAGAGGKGKAVKRR